MEIRTARTILKTIIRTLLIVGVLLIFGSIGALEQGNISLARFVFQEISGGASILSAIAVYLYGIIF